MFHDSGDFCHDGLASKATPAATVEEEEEEEEDEEVHPAKLFCCIGKLNIFIHVGEDVVKVLQNMQKEVKHILMDYTRTSWYISVKTMNWKKKGCAQSMCF